ncbi:MAG: PEP-CTERM sorting domain-containing protein [Alphaproteobacteria bacterium]|nr:PEP-CTERM sorting domain-containing protein [Alphaproteobacteria bacterium]
MGFAFALATAVAFAATATPAFAVPISQTIQLNQVYTGSTPDGPAPWLKATFTQTGMDTGTLTLTSLLGGSDFLQGLNSAKSTIGWAFYLNQSLSGLSCSSGACATNNALFGGSYNSGPVPGLFNLAFGWSSGSRFDGTDSAIYDLTFASNLSGNPFGANDSGWWSVAHVQGIGPNGSCSGWIVSGDGTLGSGSGPCGGTPPPNVPEPGALGMFGLGVLLIGGFVGWRRRYS